MTFLHKLAKRLALIPAVLVCTLSLLTSCSEGTAHDYLGPVPTKPNPSDAFIGLSIIPRDPQLVQGDSVRLEARGWLSSGLSTPASVIWSSNGAVTSGGWFQATGIGSFRVRAVSTANAALSDSVLITVLPPGGIARLDITPAAVPLAAGTRQQFTAVAFMGDGSRMFPTVTWAATGGTISASGLFTASNTPGGYTVTAIIGDGALFGRTGGIVDPPVLTGLAIDPENLMMESGTVRQFMAAASWSDGSHTVPALSWTATGGVVTSAGIFTAGYTPGTYRVIGSSPLGKADTSNVTILPRIVGIRVAPLTALLALGATQVVKAEARRSDGTQGPVAVQWSAQGGSISLNGTYTAGNTPGNYAVVGALTALGGQVFSDTAHFQVGAGAATLVQLFVRSDTSVMAGTTAQFSVAGVWSDGSSAVPAVTWSATGGSIDAAGLYTAAAVPGSFKVIAMQQNGTKADTASVIITAVPIPVVSAFTISPKIGILSSGQTRQFSTALSWNDGRVHPADISWVSAGGSITQNGLYTAGTVAGSFLVIATCGCGAADTASVTLLASTAPPVTLSQLVMSPPSVNLDPGESQIFVVSGVWSDGASSPPPVSFIATGGSITSAGVYIAANDPGTYQVIATQAGGGRADTSVVTIRNTSVTLTQLVLNPSAVTVPKGATQPFVVSASWSDGSSTVPPVTFTATGGSVSQDGVYTGGPTPGSYRLIVTHTGGTKADTSVITIPSSVTLTQLVLNPSTASLAPAGTQQFVVSGSWSDGSSVVPSVTYSATGGTISPTGLYTAGSATGSFRLIAVHAGGTKADTSAVTISSAPPTGSIGDLVVFPSPAIGFIIGPQVRALSASSPWPFFDENMNTKGLQHGASFSVSAGIRNLTGTVAMVKGTKNVVGTGTAFLTEVAQGGSIYLYNPVAASFETFYNVTVVSNTSITTTAGWFPPTMSGQPGKASVAGFDSDAYVNLNYYDLGLALYTAYYRTGNTAHLTNARKVTDSWFTSGGILDGANLTFDQSYAPRNASLGGLMLRALDGRPELWPWITAYVRYEFQMWVGARVSYSGLYYGIRDGGYMLLYAAWLAKAHPDPLVRAEFLAKAQNAAANYYARLQYPDGSWRWVDDLVVGTFMQPFMVGLLLDGMIAVHRLTSDAQVKNAIVKSVENLYAAAYRGTQPVPGLPGVSWRGMWYTVHETACPAGCGATAIVDQNTVREVRQLNPLIVQAFGYAFLITGDPKYRQWGDEIFSATFGKGRGPGADAYYSLADFREKEFNVNYRSAGRYLAWRLGP